MNQHPVFAWSDALVDEYAAMRPMNATMMGIAGHDHRWDDLSPAGFAAYGEQVSRWERALAALPPATARWDALAVAVCRDFVALERDALDHGDHRVDLNNIASAFQLVRMVFDQMDTSTAAGWEAVAARLAASVGDASELVSAARMLQNDGEEEEELREREKERESPPFFPPGFR